MPLDNEVIEAMDGLINELKSVLGEKALKLPSVHKARLVLEDSERFRKVQKIIEEELKKPYVESLLDC